MNEWAKLLFDFFTLGPTVLIMRRLKEKRDIILMNASCTLLTFSFYHKPTHPLPPPFPQGESTPPARQVYYFTILPYEPWTNSPIPCPKYHSQCTIPISHPFR
jgi:hypothetical protein